MRHVPQPMHRIFVAYTFTSTGKVRYGMATVNRLDIVTKIDN